MISRRRSVEVLGVRTRVKASSTDFLTSFFTAPQPLTFFPSKERPTDSTSWVAIGEATFFEMRWDCIEARTGLRDSFVRVWEVEVESERREKKDENVD